MTYGPNQIRFRFLYNPYNYFYTLNLVDKTFVFFVTYVST